MADKPASKPASLAHWFGGVPFRRMLQGLIAGAGAPIGWGLIQVARGRDVAADVAAQPALYLYMLIGTAFVFALFGHYVGLQESRQRQLAWRDPLTGLHNLRYFRERLDEQIAAHGREGPLALVYFDLDHFKRINDNHGHAAGDRVLVAVAQEIGQVLRHNELFARIGGEEFAVMVPRGGLDHAQALGDRILATARGLAVRLDDGTTIRQTLSLGVVEHLADERQAALCARADAAMYRAKAAGRDRMVVEVAASA